MLDGRWWLIHVAIPIAGGALFGLVVAQLPQPWMAICWGALLSVAAVMMIVAHRDATRSIRELNEFIRLLDERADGQPPRHRDT